MLPGPAPTRTSVHLVCTVVVRWHPGEPLRALALRDELVGREFDDPAPWWPEQPSAVGGRDRTAGGTWCVTDVESGTAAFVLNRPERPQAAAGAPSRGVLPLLAVRHGTAWPEHLALRGMASFSLLLAGPRALTCWTYDGRLLRRSELPEGTSMVTSGREEDGKADRFLPLFRHEGFPEGWLQVLRATEPQPDPTALVVRGEHDGKVFATVFGQLLVARPGLLELSWSRQPWGTGAWASGSW